MVVHWFFGCAAKAWRRKSEIRADITRPCGIQQAQALSDNYGKPISWLHPLSQPPDFCLLFKPTPQFLRFLLVGVMNTAFGYGLFALLTWLGLAYPVAIGLASLGGIAFNFQSIGRLVFKKGAPLSRMGRFAAVYAVVYGVNIGGVAAFLHFGLNVYLANALMILPLALLAYLLQQKFVFTAP